MSKSKMIWEIRQWTPGISWHDRRGDTECTRVAVAMPAGLAEARTAAEAFRIAQDALESLLGEVEHYTNKKTRERVYSRRIDTTYFDYQVSLEGGRWILTFKITAGEGIEAGDLQDHLDGLNAELH